MTTDSTALPDGPLGERLATCAIFCAGHVDPTTHHEHTSDPTPFGPHGSSAATKVDGCDALVSLMDLNYDPVAHRVDLPPDVARRIARQMLADADAADCDRIISGLRAAAVG